MGSELNRFWIDTIKKIKTGELDDVIETPEPISIEPKYIEANIPHPFYCKEIEKPIVIEKKRNKDYRVGKNRLKQYRRKR